MELAVSPVVKPLNLKLAQHNKFSNASFTTNFSANKTRALSGRFRANTKTGMNIKDLTHTPVSTTHLLNQGAFGKQNDTQLTYTNTQDVCELKDLKQSLPRARVRTAIPRN